MGGKKKWKKQLDASVAEKKIKNKKCNNRKKTRKNYQNIKKWKNPNFNREEQIMGPS